MKGIIGAEESTQSATGFQGLLVPFGGQFHTVIRNGLMDLAILVPFRLGVSDQDNHLFAGDISFGDLRWRRR